MKLSVQLTSPPDREDVVAEIWTTDEMIAEVRRSSLGVLLIEVYSSKDGHPWAFRLQEWMAALDDAKNQLGKKGTE